MAFVDFYCDASTGSNLNGGSDAGTVTYTSTNGNWSTATNQFIPTDGTNPVAQGVTVGQYCSIYIDGATVGVYIAKITTVVNASNGTITVSSTLKAGAAPVTSTTTRSIKVGGAWKGPNAAIGFPLTLSNLSALVVTGDKVAINLKNNATYSITANVAEIGSQNILVQGYGSSVRDGGKAIIDGGTSGASYNLLTTSAAAGWSHVDLKFQNNGATGNAGGIQITATTYVSFIRCVFSAMRGTGAVSGVGALFIECEAFGNNLSNVSALAGFSGAGEFVRCISHDNTGSNTSGFYVSTSSVVATYTNCIADTNGSHGFNTTSTTGLVRLMNCDSYNNTGDGIQIGTIVPSGTLWIENCNLIKNGGWGIDVTNSPALSVFVYNCAFGSGTQANSSGTTIGIYSGQESGSINYASNVTPWVDPANGDFRINLAAANFAGRGAFTQTAASYAGSVGYPDIGAAQSKTGPGGTFGKETSYGFA